MKVLVSAYACDPYRGSEPGVGWTAVCRIARDHEVWVLTDDHNRAGWEQARAEGKVPEGIRDVRFLRKHDGYLENRLLAHLQSWAFYRDFSRIVLGEARKWHEEIGFDLCHQVTIAAWRVPSTLWQLPVPFVWGPIGGAGYIPPAFRGMLSPAARAFERLRDFNTFLASRSRAFRDCIREAAVVFAANEETEEFLRPFRGGRPLVRLPIASLPPDKIERFRRPDLPRREGPLRLFAGGNMEGRKGVSLALRALAKAAAAGLDFHYTVAGGGPEFASLQQLAASLGLADRVRFHPGYQGDDYVRALQDSDVYFLPSFRESTPVTLLEAYLAGCYPVVADTSAQGEIVRFAGGHAVPVRSVGQLVDGLTEALRWCASHPADRERVSAEAIARISERFSSDRYRTAVEDAYSTATKGAPAVPAHARR